MDSQHASDVVRQAFLPASSQHAAYVLRVTTDSTRDSRCARKPLFDTRAQSAEKMAGKNACPTVLMIAGCSISGSVLTYQTVRQLAEQVELLQP